VLAGYCFLAITGYVGYPNKKKGKKKDPPSVINFFVKVIPQLSIYLVIFAQ
jgi:hypothetical protein